MSVAAARVICYTPAVAARRRKGKLDNAVREAVAAVGGVIEACALLKVSNRTLYRWMEEGEIPFSKPCLLLSDASDISARRLAGLDD